ncbi:hypothetical protein N7448_002998 [Penicillium atrosanguineum]|uniref:Protein HRI1 n=1 Tax=Penicillium atrosanguineum TaxID=1132637 RepID=A0A9W9L775_9EURO|nr:hypothetical protein N7448_002998 [Penicillium atrosanguineum]KAJ5315033.1 hypothetical protein N7476_005340 [Penicillium atrosanguineum]
MANPDLIVPTTCRLSTRLSIQWLPEPVGEETTDTLVMSVNGWYLDLRMKKTGGMDWAIAGQRIVESQHPVKVSFTHELDSHNAFESADCGTFEPLSPGVDKETGSMANYDLPGAPEMEYVEIWKELSFREGPEGPLKGISWVLESDDEVVEEEGEVLVTKTFLGRIWGTYLALQQTQLHRRQKDSSGNWIVSKSGHDVSAKREEWASGWSTTVVYGEAGELLPSMTEIEGQENGPWTVPGEKVTVEGKKYIVRAFEEIQ